MTITCEKCGAQYLIDEAKLKKDIISKKCPKCSHTMTIRKPQETAPSAPAGDDFGGGFIDESKIQQETSGPESPRISQGRPSLGDESPIDLTSIVEEESPKPSPEKDLFERGPTVFDAESFEEAKKPEESSAGDEKVWKVRGGDGKIYGPFTLKDLVRLIEDKRVSGLDRVSRAGGPWEKGFTAPDLAVHFSRASRPAQSSPPPPTPLTVDEPPPSVPPAVAAPSSPPPPTAYEEPAARPSAPFRIETEIERLMQRLSLPKFSIPKVAVPRMSLPKVDLGPLISAGKSLGVLIIVLICGLLAYRYGIPAAKPLVKSLIQMTKAAGVKKGDVIASYTQGLSPVQGTPEEHLQKGLTYFAMNTKEGFLMAEDELRKSLVLRPRYAQAMATLAETLLRGRDLKADLQHMSDAEELARLATQIEPKLAQGFMVQAYLNQLQGKGEESKLLALKALELMPDDLAPNYFLGSLLLGENREAEAAPYLEKAAKAKPDFAQVHIDLTTIYEKTGSAKTALVHWRSLAGIDPKNGQWQCGLADSLVRNDLKDEAVKYFKKCVEIIPGNVPARTELVGLLLDVKKKPLEAQEHLEALLGTYVAGLTPQQVNSFRGTLGRIYLETERADAAITELEPVIQQDPRNADGHYYLGEAYYMKERFRDAEKEFRTLLQIEQRSARGHVSLGNVLGKFGRLDLAIEEYKAALAIDPTYADAHYILGSYYSQRGLTYEAIDSYKNAIRYNPDDVRAHYELGMASFRVGDNETAVKELKRAKAINPRYEDVSYHLGEAYFASGKTKLAVKEFKDYVARTKGGPYVDEAKKNIRQYGR